MPTYFDTGSVLAGGERYAYELSKALSKKTQTTLFTFARKEKTVRDGTLTIQYCRTLFYAGGIVNPVSVSHLCKLKDFDAVHCLQYKTLATETAILAGAMNKKKVFVTDLAGGSIYSIARVLDLERWVTKFLWISKFNQSLHPKISKDSALIHGGVDADRFTPGAGKSGKTLLYVGRIFSLKGIHVLIEALPEGCRLEIAGQCHEAGYLEKLKTLSRGKPVEFYDSLDDQALIEKYRAALVTVLPSLVDGGFTSAMESLACGTPVIGTRLGSLPEVVRDGETGFLVPANDAAALRKKIEEVLENPGLLNRMSPECREDVLRRWTWEKVADRCLAAYRS